MKGILLVLTFVVATTVALAKDPASLIDFRADYKIHDGLIVSAYRQTVERVKSAVTEGLRLTHEGWMWTRRSISD